MKTRTLYAIMLCFGTIICKSMPSEPDGAVFVEHSDRYTTTDSLFQKVLENSRALRTARESCQVAMLEAGTGNAPPDPQVEFGYLFGKPEEIGNRVDFRISQEVEFPTAYIHSSRVKKIRISRAELEYIMVRQEVLLSARKLWIERIHLNGQKLLLEKRMQQARIINDHFRLMVEAGEAGQLAYSQSNLQFASLDSEFEQLLSEIRNNQLALNEISGDSVGEIKDTLFPRPVTIIPDSLLQAYHQSPGNRLHRQHLQLKEEEKSLAVSRHLPKLSAGYYSETVLDQKFKGVHLGITVPLWEKSNSVKKAKSEMIFAETDADRFSTRQQREVKQKINHLESLASRVKTLEEALDSSNGITVLTAALESGEISLSEYFYATDFYFRNEQLLLEYRKDWLLTEAELLKIYL